MSNYYDYLKKYDASFLHKYESGTHLSWGRKSNFMQLLYFRAYSLMTGRNMLFPHIKLKGWYYSIGVLVCLADIWGVWYFQEIYQKYSVQKWVYYQPYFKKETLLLEDHDLTDTTEEKKPFTRLKYADAIKIVYNGKEEQDTVGIRRFRYR